MIGDRMDTDVVAGIEAGLRTFLVLTGSTAAGDVDRFPFRPELRSFDSIADVVEHVVALRAHSALEVGQPRLGGGQQVQLRRHQRPGRRHPPAAVRPRTPSCRPARARSSCSTMTGPRAQPATRHRPAAHTPGRTAAPAATTTTSASAAGHAVSGAGEGPGRAAPAPRRRWPPPRRRPPQRPSAAIGGLPAGPAPAEAPRASAAAPNSRSGHQLRDCRGGPLPCSVTRGGLRGEAEGSRPPVPTKTPRPWLAWTVMRALVFFNTLPAADQHHRRDARRTGRRPRRGAQGRRRRDQPTAVTPRELGAAGGRRRDGSRRLRRWRRHGQRGRQRAPRARPRAAPADAGRRPGRLHQRLLPRAGRSRDPVEATAEILASLRAGRTRLVSLGTARASGTDDADADGWTHPRWFVFAAGLGFDAEVIARVEAQRAEGRRFTGALYVREAVAAFLLGRERRRPAMTSSVPGRPPLEDLFLCLISNVSPWTYLGARPVNPSPRRPSTPAWTSSRWAGWARCACCARFARRWPRTPSRGPRGAPPARPRGAVADRVPPPGLAGRRRPPRHRHRPARPPRAGRTPRGRLTRLGAHAAADRRKCGPDEGLRRVAGLARAW